MLGLCLVAALSGTARGQGEDAARAASDPPGLEVHLTRIDGNRLRAFWIGAPDGSHLRVRTDAGVETLCLDGLARVKFAPFDEDQPAPGRLPSFPVAEAPDSPGENGSNVPEDATDAPRVGPPAGADAVPALFHLADGGVLRGTLRSPAPQEAVRADTPLGQNVALAFGRLAAIQLADAEDWRRAAGLFDDAMADRLPGQDVLITREAEEPRAVRGRLDSIDAAEGTFVFAHRPRTFRTDRVYGVVLAAGAMVGRDDSYALTAILRDGSRVSGDLVQADAERIRLETSAGVTADLPVQDLQRLTVHSPRVVYLSDLAPSRFETAGLLHRPWPVRFDESVTRGLLSIDGRTFSRGIGVHSRAELTYVIGPGRPDGAAGPFEKLAATIGMDDAVRPGGEVVFVVRGDGQVLFESGPVTGTDPPQDIVVDVRGVNELTLLVDYADGLDLSDHADWGDVRLLKPPSEGTVE